MKIWPPAFRMLADTYSASAHVTVVEGPGAADQAIWAYARANEFVIVTKDEDFVRLSVLYGFPPKVIRILMRILLDEPTRFLSRAESIWPSRMCR